MEFRIKIRSSMVDSFEIRSPLSNVNNRPKFSAHEKVQILQSNLKRCGSGQTQYEAFECFWFKSISSWAILCNTKSHWIDGVFCNNFLQHMRPKSIHGAAISSTTQGSEQCCQHDNVRCSVNPNVQSTVQSEPNCTKHSAK